VSYVPASYSYLLLSRFINVETIRSLQIFEWESHPNTHNQGPMKATSGFRGSKEGFSVYGLFHQFGRTSQGRQLLRQYFLRPSLNSDIINERLDAVATFVHPENAEILEILVKNLKYVSNMRATLLNLRKGSSGGQRFGYSKNIWSSIPQVPADLGFSMPSRL
jgi:DNA mismatch repair protein MSH5